jgi:hypothetical protein
MKGKGHVVIGEVEKDLRAYERGAELAIARAEYLYLTPEDCNRVLTFFADGVGCWEDSQPVRGLREGVNSQSGYLVNSPEKLEWLLETLKDVSAARDYKLFLERAVETGDSWIMDRDAVTWFHDKSQMVTGPYRMLLGRFRQKIRDVHKQGLASFTLLSTDCADLLKYLYGKDTSMQPLPEAEIAIPEFQEFLLKVEFLAGYVVRRLLTGESMPSGVDVVDMRPSPEREQESRIRELISDILEYTGKYTDPNVEIIDCKEHGIVKAPDGMCSQCVIEHVHKHGLVPEILDVKGVSLGSAEDEVLFRRAGVKGKHGYVYIDQQLKDMAKSDGFRYDPLQKALFIKEELLTRMGPECGHSACRQNYIDTGETLCIEAQGTGGTDVPRANA